MFVLSNTNAIVSRLPLFDNYFSAGSSVLHFRKPVAHCSGICSATDRSHRRQRERLIPGLSRESLVHLNQFNSCAFFFVCPLSVGEKQWRFELWRKNQRFFFILSSPCCCICFSLLAPFLPKPFVEYPFSHTNFAKSATSSCRSHKVAPLSPKSH